MRSNENEVSGVIELEREEIVFWYVVQRPCIYHVTQKSDKNDVQDGLYKRPSLAYQELNIGLRFNAEKTATTERD